jgi:hypothetical protein
MPSGCILMFTLVIIDVGARRYTDVVESACVRV